MVSKDNPFIEITGANPAAGAEVLDTLTLIEEILGGEITLVTDANVANRAVAFYFESPTGVVLGQIVSITDIPASQTVLIHIGKYATLPPDTSTNHYRQIPSNLELYPGCKIKTLTANIQSGDNFSALKRTVKQYAVVP